MYHWENVEEHSQKKRIWEESRVGGSGGEQRGMVWPCGVWREMVREVAVWVTSVPESVGGVVDIVEVPGGVLGGVVAVTGNPGAPC